MKNAQRQPQWAAICVVSTGAAARPMMAAALTTTPMLRPRLRALELSSTSAIVTDQQGPSAKPSNARASNSSSKLRASPETADNNENSSTIGTRTVLRPTRSEIAPNASAEIAQDSAMTPAREPICASLKCRSGAMNGAR